MVIEKLTKENAEEWAKIRKIEERKEERGKTMMIVEMEREKDNDKR